MPGDKAVAAGGVNHRGEVRCGRRSKHEATDVRRRSVYDQKAPVAKFEREGAWQFKRLAPLLIIARAKPYQCAEMRL